MNIWKQYNYVSNNIENQLETYMFRFKYLNLLIGWRKHFANYLPEYDDLEFD